MLCKPKTPSCYFKHNDIAVTIYHLNDKVYFNDTWNVIYEVKSLLNFMRG
jgi:hypothetical protein